MLKIFLRELLREGDKMQLIRILSRRNRLNTNYKVYCIEFVVPFIGWYINEWLFKHNRATCDYIRGCNLVSYKRNWYRLENNRRKI